MPMRVCFVLLAAAATLLASNEVTAVSSHAGLSKMTAKEETQTIDAAAMAATGHRHLRSHEAAGEERASVPVNAISFKDLLKVEDLVDPTKLGLLYRNQRKPRRSDWLCSTKCLATQISKGRC